MIARQSAATAARWRRADDNMLPLVLALAVGVTWTKIEDWNAVPKGSHEDAKSFDQCEEQCAKQRGCACDAKKRAKMQTFFWWR